MRVPALEPLREEDGPLGDEDEEDCGAAPRRSPVAHRQPDAHHHQAVASLPSSRWGGARVRRGEHEVAGGRAVGHHRARTHGARTPIRALLPPPVRNGPQHES